jgi:hypothetical protein
VSDDFWTGFLFGVIITVVFTFFVVAYLQAFISL